MESRQLEHYLYNLVASKVAVSKDRGHRRAVCRCHLPILKVGLGSGCYSDTKVTHMPQAQSTFGGQYCPGHINRP